jgi:hypothetical protein
VIVRPAPTASSCQRCSRPSSRSHLDDGYDRATLVEGTSDLLGALPGRRPGSFSWGIAGLPSIRCSDEVVIPRRPPHSVSRFPIATMVFARTPQLNSFSERGSRSSPLPMHRKEWTARCRRKPAIGACLRPS